MITFKEYLNEIAIKGKPVKLEKRKVTEAELRELVKTKNENQECENLDVSEITNMKELFENTDYGTWIISDINEWDTSNVTDMYAMFYNCSKLEEAPNFDTSSVTNASYMFYDCINLKEVPNFDTSKVTNMNFMFTDCSSLAEAPELDTSNVTNMLSMFRNCSSLTEAPELDTSNVTNMWSMFKHCSKLEEAPKFADTSKVTNMSHMFSECKSLTQGDMSNWNVSKVAEKGMMFDNCPFPDDKKPKFKD